MKRSKYANTRMKKSAAAITFNQSSQKMDTVSRSIRDTRKEITKSEFDSIFWLKFAFVYSSKFEKKSNLAEKSTLTFTISLRRTKSGLSTFNRKSNPKFMFIRIKKISDGIFVHKLFGTQTRASLPNCWYRWNKRTPLKTQNNCPSSNESVSFPTRSIWTFTPTNTRSPVAWRSAESRRVWNFADACHRFIVPQVRIVHSKMEITKFFQIKNFLSPASQPFCRVDQFECLSKYSRNITEVRDCNSCELSCSNTVYDIEKLSKTLVANFSINISGMVWLNSISTLLGWIPIPTQSLTSILSS